MAKIQDSYVNIWQNGARIEAIYHGAAIRGCDPSDRIELIIKEAGREPKGFYMNAEDALAIIHSLSRMVCHMIEDGVPVKPRVEPKKCKGK